MQLNSTAATSEPLVLLSFNAGKMNWNGNHVIPDSRRGTVQLAKQSDGVLHFHWIDRTTSKSEDDIIIFGDAFLEKVDACPSGRTYVLRFTSSDRVFLMWMQDKDFRVDEANVAMFNSITGQASVKSKNAVQEASNASTIHDSESIPGETNGQHCSNNASGLNVKNSLHSNEGVPMALESSRDRFDMGKCYSNARVTPVRLSKILSPLLLETLIDDDTAFNELSSFMHPDFRSKQHFRNLVSSMELSATFKKLTAVIYSSELPSLMATINSKKCIIEKDNESYQNVMIESKSSDPMKVFIDFIESNSQENDEGPA